MVTNGIAAPKEAMEKMIGSFMAYAPHFRGPITPEESVTKVMEVVEKATVEKDGGAFVSHFGNKQWL